MFTIWQAARPNSPITVPYAQGMNKQLSVLLILGAAAASFQLDRHQRQEQRVAWMGGQQGPPVELRAMILEAAETYQIDECLIAGIMLEESAYDTRAVSFCGAQGVMQLMPFNSAEYGVSDPFDPRQSIMAGTHLLRDYLDRFDGNVLFAVAAYNAGPGSVEQYHGLPPYSETNEYIAQVMSHYYTFVRRRGSGSGTVLECPISTPTSVPYCQAPFSGMAKLSPTP